MRLRVEVAPGEALDKLTILEIKEAKIADPQKIRHVQRELLLLREATQPIIDELRSVNAKLWVVEDQLRALEQAQSFGRDFVRLARDVYITNDRRASLKARINTLLGTDIAEQKFHAA
jgi:hypothetical protein